MSLLMLLCLPAAGQLQETITVEVAQVPVVVTSSDGTPIRGLTKDSFELRVNRRQQTIEYLDVLDFSADSGRRTTSPLRERRLYVLLFGLAYTRRPGLLTRAQHAAQTAISNSNPDTDLFAVATFSLQQGAHFMTPFLRDRAATRRAVVQLRSSEVHDALGIGLSASERNAFSATGAEGGDAVDSSLERMLGSAAFQDLAREPAKRAAAFQMDGLSQLAIRLAPLDGQKHVLLFSGGFDPNLFFDGHGMGEDPEMTRSARDMSRAFNRTGVFLDAIDIEGLRQARAALIDSNESLRRLARSTGGQFVHNQNDLGASVETLQRSLDVVYVLGFHRAVSKDEDIDVRVKGLPRGAKVTFRPAIGARQVASKEIEPLQLADILINDVPQFGLTLSMAIQPHAGADADLVVAVDAKPQNLQALVYVFDETGATALYRSRQLPGGATSIVERLDLPPGHYVAKAIAWIPGTQLLGATRKDFDLPAGQR
jgi:VWFA-related protein